MKHVPNARNHPQVTVRNLLVKPARLFTIDDAILGARHDNNRHHQFLISMPHRDGARDHGYTILTISARICPGRNDMFGVGPLLKLVGTGSGANIPLSSSGCTSLPSKGEIEKRNRFPRMGIAGGEDNRTSARSVG